MVLNFNRLNFLPFMPHLVCLKKTGPGDPSFIATLINAKTGALRRRTAEAKAMSKALFNTNHSSMRG